MFKSDILESFDFEFNKYLLYSGKFVKNTRQEFLTQIRKEFDVKDGSVSYSRCHSVSYLSIVESVVKVFNLICSAKNCEINITYNDSVAIALRYLSGLVLAVKKSPLLISDDYKSMSVNNIYNRILESDNIKDAFVEYAISKNLVLKLIFRLLRKPNDKDFVEHLLDYGNILIEKLNNCHMNLRVGPAKYNSEVREYYDIISFESCENGIIIDNEMDCCALSHIKHLMYPLEDNIKFLAPRSVNLPDMYKRNGEYEIMTSFQKCDGKIKMTGEKVNDKNFYIRDWYTKGKDLIIFQSHEYS